MKTKKLVDFEVKILDPQEYQRGVEIIRREVEKKMKRTSGVSLTLGSQVIPGNILFQSAEAFESQIPNEDSINSIINNTEGHVMGIDMLAAKDPEFYEYPYLNGKNILSAMEVLGEHVIANRDHIKTNPELLELVGYVNKQNDVAIDYLNKAVMLYNRFIKKTGDEVAFYQSAIKGYVASGLRLKGFFMIRSSDLDEIRRDIRDNIDEIMTKHMENPNDLFKECDSLSSTFQGSNAKIAHSMIFTAQKMYEHVLSCCTIGDEIQAATLLANYANSLKLPTSKENAKKGLACFKEARKILGPLHQIEEGISFYEKQLKAISSVSN